MTPPNIGREVDPAHLGRCSYSESENHPPCPAEATWHGVVTVGGESLAACDEHKPIMASLATYVHPMEPACDLPDGVFIEDENRCEMPWDPTDLLRAADELVAAP